MSTPTNPPIPDGPPGSPEADPNLEQLGPRMLALEGRLRLLLHHLAGRAVLARIEIDDLLQEIYMRALAAEDVPTAEAEPGALYAFLKTLSKHVVIDAARAIRALKRSGRETPLVESGWSSVGVRASSVPLHAPGPATQVAGAESTDDLVRAFRSLDPDHARVIGLRQFEGLSAAETARRMGRSETAVHSLYRRALEAWQRASH